MEILKAREVIKARADAVYSERKKAECELHTLKVRVNRLFATETDLRNAEQSLNSALSTNTAE